MTPAQSDSSARGIPAQKSVVSHPHASDLGILAISIVMISTSGPLIVAIAAPAMAIALWRCAFATGLTGLWVGIRQRSVLGALTRREWLLSATAGALLAAHFATWVPSLRFTTVASSTALVATQPIWAAVIGRFRGRFVPRQAWVGIAVSMLGVLVLVGIDFRIDTRSLIGDALALIGAVLAAAYVTIGEDVRQTVSTGPFTLVAYGASSVVLLLVCLVGGQELGGFPTSAWLGIAALTLGAQLLGHTLIAVVLKRTSATVTSLAILFEMPGSTIIAAVWLHQLPPVSVIPAIALLFAGLVIVIRSGRVEPEPSLVP